VTGYMNIREIVEAIARATPAQIADFMHAYDEYAAMLRKKFPNAAAERRHQARQIIERAQASSKRNHGNTAFTQSEGE
jgi:hypothetical protein